MNVHKVGTEFDLNQAESYSSEPGFIELRFKAGGTLKILEFDEKKKGSVLVDSETNKKVWQLLTLRNVVDNKVERTN